MERTEITTSTPSSVSELLDRFARHIEHDGIELVPADTLSELVAAARSQRVSDVLVDVLIDPTEPAVARERAFAKLTARLLFPAPRPVVGCQAARSHAADPFAGLSRASGSSGAPLRTPSSAARRASG